MTKQLSWCAFLIVSTLTVQAQTTFQVEWIKSLRDNPIGYVIGESLVADQQGNVVVVALVDTPNGVNAMTVSFDTSGNENWRSVYSGVVMAHAWRSFVAPSGRIFSAGHNENASGTNDMHYIEYDPTTGDSLAAGVYNSPGFATGDQFTDACMDAQGNIYLAGLVRNGSAFEAGVVRFDAGGVFRWVASHPNLPGWNTGLVRGAELVGDTAVYLWTTNSTGYGALLKYDSAGALVWTVDSVLYPNEYHTALAVDENGIAFVGGRWGLDFALTKISPEGDTLWRRTFMHPVYAGVASGEFQKLLTDDDGNVYAFGYGNSGGSFGYLAAIDPNGNLIWEDTLQGATTLIGANNEFFNLHDNTLTLINTRFYTKLYRFNATSGLRTTDEELTLPGFELPQVGDILYHAGACYITGTSYTTAGVKPGFMAKLVFTEQPDGIANPTRDVAILYPNPAFAYIELPVAHDGETISVYDAVGRLVLNATADAQRLDVSTLVPGWYTLRVSGGSMVNIGVGKFVKTN